MQVPNLALTHTKRITVHGPFAAELFSVVGQSTWILIQVRTGWPLLEWWEGEAELLCGGRDGPGADQGRVVQLILTFLQPSIVTLLATQLLNTPHTILMHNTREYWMISRGLLPPFYFSAPRPLPPPLSRQQVVSLCESSYVASGAYWPERGLGAKSYNGEKAWPSINHSIFSA